MRKPDQHWHALIMAGGKGERFWPWSRENRPKQLLSLFGRKTMIEMTVDRLLALLPRERIWILTNPKQASAMKKLMPRFPASNFIVEPVGRDSAGAVMLGCSRVSASDPDAVMALLPADALIKDVKSYARVMKTCFQAAQKERVLVTIGIRPQVPSSAYGYIEKGVRSHGLSGGGVSLFKALRFTEKPDVKTAKRFIQTRRFYWNAGMFIWSAVSIRDAFGRFSPIHAQGWDAIQKNVKSYLKSGFLKLPKISIDYAVMEKAKNVYLAEGVFDWDDVGSWTAMASHHPKDSFQNVFQGNIISVDTRDCLILGKNRLIATLGVQGLIVVQTEDATLICSKAEAQKIKELVKKLPGNLK